MHIVRVRGLDFHLAGYQSFIEVKDDAHLEALIYFYGQRQLVVSSSTEAGHWTHSRPVLVHSVSVPEQFIAGALDSVNARAVLLGARGAAEEASAKKRQKDGVLRFDLFGGSLDGHALHIVVWETWEDASR